MDVVKCLLWFTQVWASSNVFSMQKSERDWRKIEKALDQREFSTVVAGQMDPEQRIRLLQQQYEQVVEDYKLTIDRIRLYPKIF